MRVYFSRIRGTLLSFFDPFMNLGVIMAFVLAKYFDYAAQAKCHLVVVIVFIILFARIPQSPQHLVNVQKQKVSSLVEFHFYYCSIQEFF